MATTCPSDAALVGYIENSADDAERQALESHFDACEDCRELLAALARRGESSKRATTGGDRYEIIEQIGAGAMGAVYIARDSELDRKVALKILHPGDVDTVGQTITVSANNPAGMLPADRDRLRDEARALAKLSHPNIVQVYDVGEMDGEVFIAMELVVGGNLREWMNVEDARPWAEVVSVFEAAGRGLAAAHGAGIVHRDFKPDNVLVADDGRVRVTDFGLAKQTMDPGALGDGAPSDVDLTSAETIKQDTTVAGTPAYMAPELFLGRPADAASDQYSFCVALHEAVYKERPSVGQPDLAQGSGVPRWLHAVILRGLAKKSSARFPDMPTLLAAIDRGRQGSRRLRLGAAAGVGVAALVAGAVWIGASTSDKNSAADAPGKTATAATDAGPVFDAAPKLTLAQIRVRLKEARRVHRKKKYREAIAAYGKLKRVLEPAKTNERKLVLARLLSYRSRAWRKLKDRNAAITDCLASIALNNSANGPDHPSVMQETVMCALYVHSGKRWADAERMLKKSIELSRKHEMHPSTLFAVMTTLGHTYNATKRPKQALGILTEALAFYAKHNLKHHTVEISTYDRLAAAQWALGKKKASLASARKGLAISKSKKTAKVRGKLRKWLAVHEKL